MHSTLTRLAIAFAAIVAPALAAADEPCPHPTHHVVAVHHTSHERTTVLRTCCTERVIHTPIARVHHTPVQHPVAVFHPVHVAPVVHHHPAAIGGGPRPVVHHVTHHTPCGCHHTTTHVET